MSLDPLAQLHLVTLLSVILIALMTLIVLRRVFFLPVITIMEQRAAKVTSARARLATGEVALKAAETEAEQMLAAARTEVDRIKAEIQGEVAGLRAERVTRAAAEAEAILAQGREEVVVLGQVEEDRLRTEVCACVSRTLTRMIGSVDEASVRFVVNRVLATKEAG